MNKNLEAKVTLENYFNSFSDEQKKDMIIDLKNKNQKLKLEVLNNSILIDKLEQSLNL